MASTLLLVYMLTAMFHNSTLKEMKAFEVGG